MSADPARMPSGPAPAGASAPVASAEAGTTLPRWVSWLWLGWIGVYAVLGQRLYVSHGPGSAIPLANYISLALVGGVLLARPRLIAEAFRRLGRMPVLLLFLAYWLALSIFAPITGYPLHTVAGAATPLAIAAFVLVGSFLTEPGGMAFPPPRLLAAIAWLQAIPGLMHALWYANVLRTLPQAWLAAWDEAARGADGRLVITGRSSGLYLDPNVYSLLGGLLLVLAVTLPMRRSQRVAIAVPAGGILLLGASRTVFFALAVVGVVAVIQAVPRRRLAWIVPSVVGGVAVLHVALTLLAGPVYARFLSRWGTLPALFSQGASADPNAVGRVNAWAHAFGVWSRHPFGSFGPPQMLLRSFIDNDYVALLSQGGVVLLFAYVAVLVVCLLRWRSTPAGRALAGMTTLVAIAGIGQTSLLFTPTFALFWPLAGALLAVERDTAEDRRRATLVAAGAFALPLVIAILLRVTAGPILK